MPEVINVYRLDYERGKGEDAQNWSAFIAGYSSEEAVKYLVKFYGGKPIKINTMGFECRLDAITNELREKITGIKLEAGKKKPGRPVNAKTKIKHDDSKYKKEDALKNETPKTKKSIIKK